MAGEKLVDEALNLLRQHFDEGGFVNSLRGMFSGPEYQSTGDKVVGDGEVNWGNPESAADFFRADKARMAMDKSPETAAPFPPRRPVEAPAPVRPVTTPPSVTPEPSILDMAFGQPVYGDKTQRFGDRSDSPAAGVDYTLGSGGDRAIFRPLPRAEPEAGAVPFAPNTGTARPSALQAIENATRPPNPNDVVNLSNNPNALPYAPSTAATPLDIRDISHLSRYRGSAMDNPEAVIFHHTAGRGTPEGVIDTLNTRRDPFTGRPMTLGAHYIIDRDGSIHAALPSGIRGAHIRPSKINDLSNYNTYGVEVIARDNSDITPAQIAAGQRLYSHLSAGRSNPLGIYGHGELNPGHKLPDEGLAIVNAIREAAAMRAERAGGGKAVSKALKAVSELFDSPGMTQWREGSKIPASSVEDRYFTGTSKDKDFANFNVGRHGAWFTKDPADASMYARENDSRNLRYNPDTRRYDEVNTADRVIPAFLRSENPFTGPLPDMARAENYKKTQSDWFDQLRAQGHDAWMPETNPNLAVILRDPSNIKSAISNTGEFDRTSPRVDRAEGGFVPEQDRNTQLYDAVTYAQNLTGQENLRDVGSALGKTWPVEMAKSAYSAMKAPGDVYQGRLDPRSDEGVKRAMDLAGLVMTGGGGTAAVTGEGAGALGMSLLNPSNRRPGGPFDPTNTGSVFRDVKYPDRTPSQNKAATQAIEMGRFTETDLPIRSMYATQPKVNSDFALPVSSNRGNLPVVERIGDEFFVRDGHHRLTKIAMEGKDIARVNLVDPYEVTPKEMPLLDWKPKTAKELVKIAREKAELDALDEMLSSFYKSPKASGGHVLSDDYPPSYMPNVGRQVMAGGGEAEDDYQSPRSRVRAALDLVQNQMAPQADGEGFQRALQNYRNFPQQPGEATARPLNLDARDVIGGAIAGAPQRGDTSYLSKIRGRTADAIFGSKGLPGSGTLGFGIADAPLVTGLPLMASDIAGSAGRGDYAEAALGAALPAAFYARQPIGKALGVARDALGRVPSPVAAGAAGAAVMSPEDAEAGKADMVRKALNAVRLSEPAPRKMTLQEVRRTFDPRAGEGMQGEELDRLVDAYGRVASPASLDPDLARRGQEIAQTYITKGGSGYGGRSYFAQKPSVPLEDLGRAAEPIPYTYEPKTIVDKSWETVGRERAGSPVISLGGDLSDLVRLRGYGPANDLRALANPTDIHAGFDYMREPNLGSVWSNNPEHAAMLEKAVLGQKDIQRAVKKDLPVMAVANPMGPGAIDSAKNMMDLYLSALEGSAVPPDYLSLANKIIRSGSLGDSPKAKEKLKEKLAGFPGFENMGKAREFLLNNPDVAGTTRAAIIKGMERSDWVKKGFPEVGQLRVAASSPKFMMAPGNMMGGRMVELDPRMFHQAELNRYFKHFTYGGDSPGTYYADVPLIHRQYGAPDATDMLMAKYNQWRPGATKKAPPKAPITVHPFSTDQSGRDTWRKMFEEQRMVQSINDRMMESIRRGEQRRDMYGFKKGGSVSHRALMLASSNT